MIKLTMSLALALTIANYSALVRAQKSTVRGEQSNAANDAAAKAGTRWEEAPNNPPAAVAVPAAGVGAGASPPNPDVGATTPRPVPLQSSGANAATSPAP